MKKFLLLFQAFGKNGLLAKVPHIIRMVKKKKKGEYKMDFKSVLIPSLAIIYILSPLDIIPDWLLGIGSLDDFAILALTLPFVLKELEKFLAWEQEQKNRTNNITDAEIIQ